ncbi:MAG TPA: SMP-30/gluconolactonase/LRE family protein [Bryobacteraceae bacterium]|nr:SMP-30/gluconolactonase/LRE family protein [Bryobacteraceae bacterium]
MTRSSSILCLLGFNLLIAVPLLPQAQQPPSEFVVSKLAVGYTFTEGPAWSKDGFLVFSDIPTDRILKWVPGEKVAVLRTDSHGASGNAFDGEGRLYTCETRARRVTRTEKNGRIDVLADKWEGKRLNAPSAIAVSRNGHVYFTDPAFGSQADHRELDFYGVYHIPPKGPMKLIAKPSGRPNGIALSPNGRILYVSNADERNIRAYDVDRAGDASNERVFISGLPGVPGGLHVDEKGDLYIAAKDMLVYSKEGKLLHTIALEDRPSNCVLGEADSLTLFVTARGTVYRLRMEAKGESH